MRKEPAFLTVILLTLAWSVVWLLNGTIGIGLAFASPLESPLPSHSPIPFESIVHPGDPQFRSRADCVAYYTDYYDDPRINLECTRYAVEACIQRLPEFTPPDRPTVAEYQSQDVEVPTVEASPVDVSMYKLVGLWMGKYPLYEGPDGYIVEGYPR
jgi:hypothetical protein